uniref:phage protein n=1 Tax=Acetatifactor sp. TaxID=1872090 RepID=UPI0040570B8D
MASDVVIKDKQSTHYSQMGIAIQELAGQIPGDVTGQYGQRVIIESDNVKIDSNVLDCEFSIPFDDNTEANEAEILVYNLSNKTVKALKKNNKITVKAGYGKDRGLIFSGYISKTKTAYEDVDKITRIWALDSEDRKEKDIESESFAGGTQASTILRKLVQKLGLTIAAFKVERDHTFKDEVTVDGGLMDNIKRYAQLCKVSAYICKSKVYVCKLGYKKGKLFNLKPSTGLLSVTEFEETVTVEDYEDTVKGYECTMLLTHQIQTGSAVKIETADVKGTYWVREGRHEYSNDECTTTIKAIEV